MFCGYIFGGLSACVNRTESASSPPYTWDAGTPTDAGADAGVDAGSSSGGGGGGGGGKGGCALTFEPSPSVGLFLAVMALLIWGARGRKRMRER